MNKGVGTIDAMFCGVEHRNYRREKNQVLPQTSLLLIDQVVD